MRYTINGRLLAALIISIIAWLAALPARADTPPPPGANNWNCRTSFLHPRPVVLVHGTFENMFDNWGFMSSTLSVMGYCVYALNYGENPYSQGLIYGLGPMVRSAAELSAFVDRVRSSTGATKVDIIGHSQGGMLPRYYMKYLGGASKVNRLIGLAPSNHGTDLGGLLTMAESFPLFQPYTDQIRSGGEQAAANFCPACVDQLKGSDFLRNLNAGGDTQSGVKYTVIATRYDEVVTPYTSQFLSGSNVTNITIQDKCPFDPVEHVFLPHDPIAINLVLATLDASTTFITPSMYCGGGSGGNSGTGGTGGSGGSGSSWGGYGGWGGYGY